MEIQQSLVWTVWKIVLVNLKWNVLIVDRRIVKCVILFIFVERVILSDFKQNSIVVKENIN